MAFVWVNGIECPTPSVFKWGLQDISASDAGRTQDVLMHKNRIGQKVSIQLQWNMPSPSTVAKVLKMFNPEYFNVKYWDPMSNSYETRVFYRGDASAPVYTWSMGGRYENLAFNIIER